MLSWLVTLQMSCNNTGGVNRPAQIISFHYETTKKNQGKFSPESTAGGLKIERSTTRMALKETAANKRSD